MENLKVVDPEIATLIKEETERQRDKIRLIPSENYVSSAVLEATGSVLTNKYSEGYAKKRYYEGQQIIDQIELLYSDHHDPSISRVDRIENFAFPGRKNHFVKRRNHTEGSYRSSATMITRLGDSGSYLRG